jgi:uncharacterized protein (PEP-CTERM system associated)
MNNERTERAHRKRRNAMGLHPLALAVSIAACCASALAQNAPDAAGADGPSTPPPRYLLEPRVTAGVTLSSNGDLSAGGRDEQILEVSPGVLLVANLPRLKGFLDYSLRGIHYLQETSDSQLRNALQAFGTLDVYDGRGFIDFGGVIDTESLSIFGSSSGGTTADRNRTETRTWRISPYWRSRLAGEVDVEARYDLQWADAGVENRSDVTDRTTSLALSRRLPDHFIGWTANASSSRTDYSLATDSSADRAQVGLIVVPSDTLELTLLVGRERNDIITAQQASYRNNGVSVDWRPSERSTARVAVEDRYFGTGHNVLLQHRTPQTIWRYVDTRSAQTPALRARDASLGDAFDLLDDLYAAQEPDPVRRAQLVNAELQRLGIAGDTQLLTAFLNSTATLERTQEVSLALLGLRSTITIAYGRRSSSRLSAFAGQVGDDFDNISRISQRGWNLTWGHRLDPRVGLSASLANERVNTGLASADSRKTSITLGLAARIAPRTTATALLRRTVDRGSGNPYNETALGAFVTHRF